MTIEEKVKIVEQALRMGAQIDISFYECESKEDATEKVKKLSPVFHESEHKDTHWIASGQPYDEDRTEEEDGIEISAYY